MASYTIKNAMMDREFEFGDPPMKMRSYKLLFEGMSDAEPWVNLAQLADKPMPAIGDKLEGDIEQTKYGPKFKKAKSGNWSGGGRPQVDPVAMYISYAKDILIAKGASVYEDPYAEAVTQGKRMLDLAKGSPAGSTDADVAQMAKDIFQQ